MINIFDEIARKQFKNDVIDKVIEKLKAQKEKITEPKKSEGDYPLYKRLWWIQANLMNCDSKDFVWRGCTADMIEYEFQTDLGPRIIGVYNRKPYYTGDSLKLTYKTTDYKDGFAIDCYSYHATVRPLCKEPQTLEWIHLALAELEDKMQKVLAEKEKKQAWHKSQVQWLEQQEKVS